jgi:hypothetical protein
MGGGVCPTKVTPAVAKPAAVGVKGDPRHQDNVQAQAGWGTWGITAAATNTTTATVAACASAFGRADTSAGFMPAVSTAQQVPRGGPRVRRTTCSANCGRSGRRRGGHGCAARTSVGVQRVGFLDAPRVAGQDQQLRQAGHAFHVHVMPSRAIHLAARDRGRWRVGGGGGRARTVSRVCAHSAAPHQRALHITTRCVWRLATHFHPMPR